jgi:hypothetical protein
VSAASIPVTKVVQVHEALQAAMAHTNFGAAGEDPALWDQLNHARAIVEVYLLKEAGVISVDLLPAKVPA